MNSFVYFVYSRNKKVTNKGDDKMNNFVHFVYFNNKRAVKMNRFVHFLYS